MGCAFAICLEKKQQRDKLCAVSMSVDQTNSSFTRHGSFRQATLTERLQQDAQVLMPPPTTTSTSAADAEENPFAVSRPHATDLMLQRQTSFRGFGGQLGQSSPFKRQLSLRLNELPSTLERQQLGQLFVEGGGDNSSGNIINVPDNNNTNNAAAGGLENSGLEDLLKDGGPLAPGGGTVQLIAMLGELNSTRFPRLLQPLPSRC